MNRVSTRRFLEEFRSGLLARSDYWFYASASPRRHLETALARGPRATINTELMGHTLTPLRFTHSREF